LLSDKGVGVPALAAEALKKAALQGVSIERCEDDLEKALENRYASAEAAGALTVHYISRGESGKAASLLSSNDSEIARGAREAFREVSNH
jgi:hypothetical protein